MALPLSDVFVHVYAVEVRRKPTGKGDSYRVEVATRYVCACGWATRWWRDSERARCEIRKHALDGQTARLR